MTTTGGATKSMSSPIMAIRKVLVPLFIVFSMLLLAFYSAHTPTRQHLVQLAQSIKQRTTTKFTKKPTKDGYEPGNCSLSQFMSRSALTTGTRLNAFSVAYADLYVELYQPLGYSLRRPSKLECRNLNHYRVALLPLREREPKTCDLIFSDWVQSSKNYTTPKKAPEAESISASLKLEYTLRDTVAWRKWYLNNIVFEKDNDGKSIWNRSYFNDMATALRTKSVQICEEPVRVDKCFPYGDSVNMLHAMRGVGVSGTRVAVIGTQIPWVEGIALHLGATQVVTFEYRDLILDHPAISVLHPIKAAETWKSLPPFDHIISFSSLEHSGLGRYSDPLGPWDDLVELRKVHCLLKPGGTFMLGVPVSRDRVNFNAAREYGAIRLPLLLAVGFELVHFYANNKDLDDIAELNTAVTQGYGNQPVLVLRKIKWTKAGSTADSL